ncbi:GNAT family N-acetyltransferase [Altererythrobacter aquiaggeris]|uniref:GNAT family N-acetyltransferase n=1 Tax=Aestuarierythrobacter aquiaggeris TaxID=1898396 RepID=UPI003019B0EC
MIETARLIIRDWRDDDIDAFHGMCSDPAVMATLGPLMDRTQTASLITDLQGRAQRFGHTFWALERKDDSRMIGFTGLVRGKVEPVKNRLEIGWRLASETWGQGYAREAAQACFAWAAANRTGEPVFAITSVKNKASRGLMVRLGMTHLPRLDFGHPGLAHGDPLQPHVTYVKEPG